MCPLLFQSAADKEKFFSTHQQQKTITVPREFSSFKDNIFFYFLHFIFGDKESVSSVELNGKVSEKKTKEDDGILSCSGP